MFNDYTRQIQNIDDRRFYGSCILCTGTTNGFGYTHVRRLLISLNWEILNLKNFLTIASVLKFDSTRENLLYLNNSFGVDNE